MFSMLSFLARSDKLLPLTSSGTRVHDNNCCFTNHSFTVVLENIESSIISFHPYEIIREGSLKKLDRV